jgi:hypothetical protein
LRLFFKRYTQWRVGVVWWLLAIFGILLSLNTVASLVLGPSVWSDFLRDLSVILPTYLVTLVVGVILGPIWEEPGGRGFALPRLQERSGPIFGTLILGAVWALWHLPGYLGGWMTVGLVPLLLSGMAFSILNLGLQQHTGKHSVDDPAALLQQCSDLDWERGTSAGFVRLHAFPCIRWLDSGHHLFDHGIGCPDRHTRDVVV